MKLEREHLTELEVTQFQRRELTQAERRELDAHVAWCEDCLRRVINPAEPHLALTSLTEAFLPSADEQPFHLSQAELQSYNHENLDEADRTIFESHLEICSECKEEAAELRAGASLAPAAGARSAERIKSETKSRPRWFPAFGRPVWTSPALVIGVLAAVGCVLLILTLLLQKKPAQSQEQTGQTEQRDNPARPAEPQNNSTEPAPAGEIAGSNNNASAPVSIDNSNTPTEEPKTNDSSSVVRLKDGGAEVGLDEQGKLKGLENLAPQTQRAVQTALASEHLPEPPALNELAGAKINLMGDATDGLPFKLISPVGIVIQHSRPTLRWHSLDGATSYTVSVFDADFNRVAKSNPQSTREWTLPTSLQNGKVYSWEVTALKDNQEVTSPVAPAPRAQFKIVEVERLKEIANVLKERPRSHLTLGVLYARAGLLTEAENELRVLSRDNPQSSVAKRLLRTVQAWRSR